MLVRIDNKGFVETLDEWTPNIQEKDQKKGNDYYQNWLNLDLILWTSIGAGFIALRDDEKISSDEMDEQELDRIFDVFVRGLDFGFKSSVQNLNANYNNFVESLRGNQE